MVQYQIKGKINVLNLACRLVDGPHNSLNIKNWLTNILRQYGIQDSQILVIAADSAANIQKAARDYLKELDVNQFMVELPRASFIDDEDNDTEGLDEQTRSRMDPLLPTEFDVDLEEDNDQERNTGALLVDEPVLLIPSSFTIPSAPISDQQVCRRTRREQNGRNCSNVKR